MRNGRRQAGVPSFKSPPVVEGDVEWLKKVLPYVLDDTETEAIAITVYQ